MLKCYNNHWEKGAFELELSGQTYICFNKDFSLLLIVAFVECLPYY